MGRAENIGRYGLIMINKVIDNGFATLKNLLLIVVCKTSGINIRHSIQLK
jgi:hypothetical protein